MYSFYQRGILKNIFNHYYSKILSNIYQGDKKMELILDRKEDKSLAQLCSFLDIPVRHVAYRNGNGLLELILGCIGASSLADEFGYYFDPYYFYKGYRNDNDHFNPEIGMIKICSKIKSDKELLNEFLNEIFRRLQHIQIEDDTLEKIKNGLELLGYELQIDYDELGCKYSIQYLSIGEVERQSEMSLMRKELKYNCTDVLKHYNEALSTYSNGNFKSCIDNCRTAFEKYFAALDKDNADYLEGILKATGERVIDNGSELISKNKIFKYWLHNNKGANRYRILATLYSAMSGLGAHGEDNPGQEDALMILRMTEDAFLWNIQKK